MGATRRYYTDQFKQEAIKLAESVGIPQAASDLGINSGNIRRWQRGPQNVSLNAEQPSGLTDIETENLRPKKELRYVYEVNDILKKSLGIFAKEKSPSSR